MAVHFECLDYEGVPVSCDADVWRMHVLQEHPELEEHASVVQQAIRKPLLVYQDRDYPNRKLFYLTFSLSLSSRRRHAKVVVEYHREQDGTVKGRVITAFPSRNVRRGDRLLWASPTMPR